MDPRTGRGLQAPRPASDREVGLAAVRRLTRGTAVAVAGSVAVLLAYVAHIVPGRHVSAGGAATTGGSGGTPVSVPTPTPASGTAPGTASGGTAGGGAAPAGGSQTGGGGASVGGGGGFTPPPTAPQPTYHYTPQVVSGSS